MAISRRLVLLTVVLASLAALGTAAQASQAASLTYYGGPVSHSMNVYVVKWGSLVRSSYTSTTSGDPAFFNYLASQSGSTSDIGGVLAQYMDTSSQNSKNTFSYGGMTQITPSVGADPSSTNQEIVNDSDIQSALQSNINSSTLPAPAGNGMSTMYVVLFPPNDNVCQGGSCAYSLNGFCAYHGSFPLNSSTHVLYTAGVDNGPGTPNYGLCGPSSNDVNNQTDVLSHEFSETINDPLVAESSVWGPPLAWYNQAQGEIGDICVGSGELGFNGPWAVQKEWSNRDNGCVVSESAFSAPTAAFLAGSTAAPAQSISFDASASSDPSSNSDSASYSGTTYSLASGITNYEWNWGDGTSSTSSTTPTANHAYSQTGNYNVSLTVTDALGFTSTVTHQVAITSNGTIPPQVTTGTAGAISSSGATLNGTVNPENQTVSYQFVYGTDPTALNQSTQLTSGLTGSTATAVSATLSSLQASTTYYYQLVATDGANNNYTGTVQHFTTNAAAPPPQTPVATTSAPTNITTSGATLNGTVNPGGSSSVTYRFSYGTSPTSLTRTTTQRSLTGGTTAVPVSAGISGLSAGTTYYFQLTVVLAGRSYTSGTPSSFQTLIPLPTVSTGGTSGVSSSGATINGTVNPRGFPTTYLVEFGPTSAYGFSTVASGPVSGNFNMSVRVPLTGLNPSTTYHYRLDATNGGGTAVGVDRTFRTTAARVVHSTLSFQVAGPYKLRDALTDGLGVRYECAGGCTANFTVSVVPEGRVGWLGSVPITVAHSTSTTKSSTGYTKIGFDPSEQDRLSGSPWVMLIVSGDAASSGTEPSQAVSERIRLR